MRVSCLAFVAACAPSTPSAKLADLPSPQVGGSFEATSGGGLVLGYDTSVDCYSLSTAVHATVDGEEMTVTSRGGWRNTIDGNECDPIWLEFPQRTLADHAVTSIVLDDGTTTWSVGVEGLAPSRWSFALTTAHVAEGSDFTVQYGPAAAGVALGSIFIDRAGIEPEVAHTADSETVHIDAGYWSEIDPTLHGTTKQAALEADLGPLVVHGCDGFACGFSTTIPDPALPIQIAIP